jgi:hypothetical protein
MFEGTGGGGKTSVGVALGNVLIGEHFAATTAPETGKELAEMMSGTPFAVFDEWSSVSKGVEKTFKSLSTGGVFQTRELYTTSTMVDLPCDAAVILTSNCNPTREIATSRRFLVVPVAPRQTMAGDKVYNSTGDYLLPNLMNLREDIWEELLSDLGACVLALHNSSPATRTSFSMADFGVWVQRIADYEGWGDAAEEMFLTVEKKQEQQTASTQALASLIPEYFFACPDDQGEFYTARQWATNFQQVIDPHEKELSNKINTSYIQHILKVYEDLYTRKFRMKIDQDKHTKINRYALWLPVPDDVEITVPHEEEVSA